MIKFVFFYFICNDSDVIEGIVSNTTDEDNSSFIDDLRDYVTATYQYRTYRTPYIPQFT